MIEEEKRYDVRRKGSCERSTLRALLKNWTVAVFTHQVDCVKHLNFTYRGAAWVRQIAIVVADGKRAQSCKNNEDLHSKMYREHVQLD